MGHAGLCAKVGCLQQALAPTPSRKKTQLWANGRTNARHFGRPTSRPDHQPVRFRWSGRPTRPAEVPGVGSAGRHHRRAEPPEPNRPADTTAEPNHRNLTGRAEPPPRVPPFHSVQPGLTAWICGAVCCGSPTYMIPCDTGWSVTGLFNHPGPAPQHNSLVVIQAHGTSTRNWRLSALNLVRLCSPLPSGFCSGHQKTKRENTPSKEQDYKLPIKKQHKIVNIVTLINFRCCGVLRHAAAWINPRPTVPKMWCCSTLQGCGRL